MTDEGLKKPVGLKSLQSLRLDSTKVTDAGLKELVKNLRLLALLNTKVTDTGVKEFQQVLPRGEMLK